MEKVTCTTISPLPVLSCITRAIAGTRRLVFCVPVYMYGYHVGTDRACTHLYHGIRIVITA